MEDKKVNLNELVKIIDLGRLNKPGEITRTVPRRYLHNFLKNKERYAPIEDLHKYGKVVDSKPVDVKPEVVISGDVQIEAVAETEPIVEKQEPPKVSKPRKTRKKSK